MKQLKNIFIIILVAVIVWMWFDKCGHAKPEIREVIKTKTEWIRVKGDISYVPVIVNHYLPGKTPKEFYKFDTLNIGEIMDVDTAAILADYHSYNTYDDIRHISDSSGLDGNLYITDTVSRNRILGRGISYDIKYPKVTVEKTRTIYDKRVQLYAQLGLFGNEKDWVSGSEFNVLMKTKSDQIIGAGYQKIFNGGHYYKVNFAQLISLRKRK